MNAVMASACLAGPSILSGANQTMSGTAMHRPRPIFTRSETSDECSCAASCVVASVLMFSNGIRFGGLITGRLWGCQLLEFIGSELL